MPDESRTLDLPGGQRFDFWKDTLAEMFVPLEVTRPEKDADFRGFLAGTDLGALRLVEVRAQAHTALRTSRLVARAPAGCYKLGLQLRGSAVLVQDGREAMLTPGKFALYDTDRPYTLAFEAEHRMLILVFPRELLRLPYDSVARLTATALPGSGCDLGSLIPSFLTQVASVIDGAPTHSTVRLAGNVLDLLTTVLAERLDRSPADGDAPHRALMLQLTTFIEGRLPDPELSPQLIADAHHISLRQLHKLFHSSGTTVAGWIRQRRLEHCSRDLVDPRAAELPVSAIGARWGYPDPAHFSRLFKAAYGMGPRDFRYRTAGAVSPA
jgi:AraC-like DNA-binding protein